MHIESLDDLQVVTVDSLGKQFPENDRIADEEVLAKAAIEVSMATSNLMLYFSPSNKDRNTKHVLLQLNVILRWVTACAFVLEVEYPSEGERVLYGENWPEEMLHDGIVASLALQHRMTELFLDYVIEDEYDKDTLGEDLWAVISLVEVIATRVLCSFEDALTYRA